MDKIRMLEKINQLPGIEFYQDNDRHISKAAVTDIIQSEPEETCTGCIHDTGKAEDSTNWCFVCKRGYSDEYEKEGE